MCFLTGTGCEPSLRDEWRESLWENSRVAKSVLEATDVGKRAQMSEADRARFVPCLLTRWPRAKQQVSPGLGCVLCEVDPLPSRPAISEDCADVCKWAHSSA